MSVRLYKDVAVLIAKYVEIGDWNSFSRINKVTARISRDLKKIKKLEMELYRNQKFQKEMRCTVKANIQDHKNIQQKKKDLKVLKSNARNISNINRYLWWNKRHIKYLFQGSKGRVGFKITVLGKPDYSEILNHTSSELENIFHKYDQAFTLEKKVSNGIIENLYLYTNVEYSFILWIGWWKCEYCINIIGIHGSRFNQWLREFTLIHVKNNKLKYKICKEEWNHFYYPVLKDTIKYLCHESSEVNVTFKT